MANPEYLSVNDVAKIFHKHPDTIRIWCRTGKLAGAYRIGKDWFIPRAALEPPKPQSEKPSVVE